MLRGVLVRLCEGWGGGRRGLPGGARVTGYFADVLRYAGRSAAVVLAILIERRMTSSTIERRGRKESDDLEFRGLTRTFESGVRLLARRKEG